MIKHRYSHMDAELGRRVSSRHRMTAEAAAASEMIDPVLIEDSRDVRYVADNPNHESPGLE